jgi:hypothetical protein
MSGIIVLAKRFPPGTINQEALYLTRSDQGDAAWQLRVVEFQGLFGEPIEHAIARGAPNRLLRAGTFTTLMHGLVDEMADWGASDDEIIPLADFIPRLEQKLQEIVDLLGIKERAS